MATFASHQDYVAAQPQDVQAILRKVQGAIRKAIPEAEEVIAWNMPSYKLGGKHVVGFCAFRRHWSLFGSTRGLEGRFGRELAKRNVGKGTIQFPYDEPVPVKLVEGIARFRAKPGRGT